MKSSNEPVLIESFLGSLEITAEEMNDDRVSNSIARIALILQDLHALKKNKYSYMEQKRYTKRLCVESERLHSYLCELRKEELRKKGK